MSVFTTTDAAIKLPDSVLQSIVKHAGETSVVARLSGQTPMELGRDTVIPVYDGEINLSAVAEGQRKPTAKGSTSKHTITSQKHAVIVPVSMELARTNPGGVFDAIAQDLANAVARTVDAVALKGKDGTGNVLAGQSNINQTTNRIELAGATPEDYKAAFYGAFDLISGEYDVDGIAADPRTRAKLLQIVNQTPGDVGIPNLTSQSFTLGGINTEFAKTVRRTGGQDDSTKMILGQWDKLKWGMASGVEITRSDSAVYFDEAGDVRSAFSENLVLLRCEFFLGATVLDADAFAIVEDKVA